MSRQVGFARAAKLTRRTMIIAAGVLALWVIPAVASATPQWDKGGEPITSSQEIKWKGTIQIEAWVAGAGYAEFKCEDTGSGLAKVGGVEEETKWTMSNCKPEGQQWCVKSVSAEALHLPWKAELTASEGKIFNTIQSPGDTAEIAFKCEYTSNEYIHGTTWFLSSNHATMTNVSVGVEETIEGQQFGGEGGSGHPADLWSHQTIQFSKATGTLSVH